MIDLHPLYFEDLSFLWSVSIWQWLSKGGGAMGFPNYIATERYRDTVAISFCRDIVCLPNDFATNFMKYFNVEKEQF